MSRNPKFEWQDAFAESGTRGCALAVGRLLGDRWNGDENHPYASEEWLAERAHYSVRQVRRALLTLQEDGWIARVSKGHRMGTSSVASRWRMTFPNRTPTPTDRTSVSDQPDIGVRVVDLGVDLYPLDPGGGQARAEQGSEEPEQERLAHILSLDWHPESPEDWDHARCLISRHNLWDDVPIGHDMRPF